MTGGAGHLLRPVHDTLPVSAPRGPLVTFGIFLYDSLGDGLAKLSGRSPFFRSLHGMRFYAVYSTIARGSTLIAVMVTLVATTIFAHQAAEPRAAESKTAMLVCKMIEQSHISHVKINDEISVKLFNRYLELLDPRKLYFTQADVDALGQDRAKLGEKLKGGNVDFAYNTFDLFLQRVKTQCARHHAR